MRKWIQLYASLAFLPIEYVEFGFKYIKSRIPTGILDEKNEKYIDDKLIEVDDYVYNTYGFNGIFKPELWNHFDKIVPRTLHVSYILHIYDT